MIGRCYRNPDDTARVRVYQREDGRWWLEEVHRHPRGGWAPVAWSEGSFAGATELEITEHACAFMRGVFGEPGAAAVEIFPVDELHEGWIELEPWQAPEGSPEIEVGQIWRRGKRRAVVEHYGPDTMTGIVSITVRYVEASGREVGTAIRGRRSAAWSYGEQRFRKLYKIDD